MHTYNILESYLAYNLWANRNIIRWALDQPSDTIYKEADSSFSTIPQTLLHILRAEAFYLSIVAEVPLQKIVLDKLALIAQALEEVSEKFLLEIKSLGEEGVQGSRKVKGKGVDGSYPISTFVMHCVNHSTYHRGQLISMGHQLDLSKAPGTDYYRFMLAPQL